MFLSATKRRTHERINAQPEDRPLPRLVRQQHAETRIVIEPVTDSYTAAGAAHVRREVFEREWKIRLPRPCSSDMLTLVARVESRPDPVAVLTVMETTGEHQLHRSYGLSFPENARIARYTQLAVLKPYRGLNIPAQLLLEAWRRFVRCGAIDYTWLLFDAERATGSSFCRLLGFRAGAEVVESEYGRSRVLIRKERAGLANDAGHDVPQRILTTLQNGYLPGHLKADEWVAQ